MIGCDFVSPNLHPLPFLRGGGMSGNKPSNGGDMGMRSRTAAEMLMAEFPCRLAVDISSISHYFT
jgi:hypothetical protein